MWLDIHVAATLHSIVRISLRAPPAFNLPGEAHEPGAAAELQRRQDHCMSGLKEARNVAVSCQAMRTGPCQGHLASNSFHKATY